MKNAERHETDLMIYALRDLSGSARAAAREALVESLPAQLPHYRLERLRAAVAREGEAMAADALAALLRAVQAADDALSVHLRDHTSGEILIRSTRVPR